MGSSKASYGVMGMCVMMMMMVMAMTMPGGVAAQGPAAAPVTDCSSVIIELIDCLPFVMGQAAAPVATCCSNLSSVVVNSPQCLCQLYNTTFTEPLGVNVSQALLLPPACKVSTPDPSLCSVIGIPVPGPATSTAPVTAPSAPTAPSSTATPTPATSPSASAPSSVPTPATTPTSVAPSGAAVPSGPPAGLEPTSSTAPPPNPSSATHIGAKNVAIVASSLFALAILLP